MLIAGLFQGLGKNEMMTMCLFGYHCSGGMLPHIWLWYQAQTIQIRPHEFI